MKMKFLIMAIALWGGPVLATINVKKVSGDLSKNFESEAIWQTADPDVEISLVGQPMVPPKPKTTETPSLRVAAVHNGKWVAFRIRWKDAEISEADRLATFSDAVAVQFPVKNNEMPPPFFMGGKDDPVHIFHWRYQYQLDAKHGKKPIEKVYPNMSTDMYPMDFKQKGNFKQATQKQKEAFVGGTAAGNPQSFPKLGVDEIFAEGFGTSAVSDRIRAKGVGEWKNGEWTVFISRPLVYEDGSKLYPGKLSNVGFAVWQGGKKEVGAIKSVTMMWTPLTVSER
jgi:hypothetical protein